MVMLRGQSQTDLADMRARPIAHWIARPLHALAAGSFRLDDADAPVIYFAPA